MTSPHESPIECPSPPANPATDDLEIKTMLKRTEEALRESEEKYRSLVEILNIGVFRSTEGSDGRFLEANTFMAKMFEYETLEELMKVSLSAFYQDSRERKSFVEEIARKGFVKNRELELRKKDGTQIWVSCSARAELNEAGNIEWIDGVMEDITERKLASEKLWYKAIHDSLTGLFNQRYFMEQLASSIKSAERYDYPLSICLCNLDKFDSVIDAYGQGLGDEIIATFGAIIREELRNDDMGGRKAGNKFCIFFRYISASEAAVCAERIRRRFQKAVFEREDKTTFSCTATFGIAELVARYKDEKELLKSANMALYKAKELGRNCVVVNAERFSSPLPRKTPNSGLGRFIKKLYGSTEG